MLQQKSTPALPYISRQGIARAVFITSRMRSTTHVLGAWTDWPVDPFPAVLEGYNWIQTKSTQIQVVGIVAVLLGPWDGTYNCERLFELD